MHLYWSISLVLLGALRCKTADSPMIYGSAELEHNWAEAFKLIITVKMQYPVPNGWRIALIFSQPIKKIDVWRAIVLKKSADQRIHDLKEEYFNKKLATGQVLTFAVVAYKGKRNSPPGNVTVIFKGGNKSPRLPTQTPVGKLATLELTRPQLCSLFSRSARGMGMIQIRTTRRDDGTKLETEEGGEESTDFVFVPMFLGLTSRNGSTVWFLIWFFSVGTCLKLHFDFM